MPEPIKEFTSDKKVMELIWFSRQCFFPLCRAKWLRIGGLQRFRKLEEQQNEEKRNGSRNRDRGIKIPT